MIPCAGCSRFIRSDVIRCPFCDAVQSDMPSPLRPAVASVLLGLALTACGSPTGDDASGSASSTSAPGTVGDSTAASMTSTTMSDPTAGPMSTTMMSGVDTEGEEAVTAYGGPDVDTSPPEEETAGSSTMGDSSGTGTGTGTGTSSSSGQ